jgi:deuterolysin
MRLTALSTAVLALAQHAYALPVEGDASGLDITLSRISDTRIKAVVKNAGKEDVTFVHLNFFRDSAPVKKVGVFKNGMDIPSRHYQLETNFS